MSSIANGKVVSLAYTLKNDSGETLDQADTAEPFVFMQGAGQIIPGLETALDGLKKGDKKQVTVAPDQGYGQIDAGLKIAVNKSQFPPGAQLVEGMQFETASPEGHGIIFTIEKLEGDKVHINGNHPLAGETLHFDVEVLEVRDATEDEKSHGHAHGPDGHGHDH
jgi:FKBP-type peptidyl-prolyl cis-trans isomerase SlyD